MCVLILFSVKLFYLFKAAIPHIIFFYNIYTAHALNGALKEGQLDLKSGRFGRWKIHVYKLFMTIICLISKFSEI